MKHGKNLDEEIEYWVNRSIDGGIKIVNGVKIVFFDDDMLTQCEAPIEDVKNSLRKLYKEDELFGKISFDDWVDDFTIEDAVEDACGATEKELLFMDIDGAVMTSELSYDLVTYRGKTVDHYELMYNIEYEYKKSTGKNGTCDDEAVKRWVKTGNNFYKVFRKVRPFFKDAVINYGGAVSEHIYNKHNNRVLLKESVNKRKLYHGVSNTEIKNKNGRNVVCLYDDDSTYCARIEMAETYLHMLYVISGYYDDMDFDEWCDENDDSVPEAIKRASRNRGNAVKFLGINGTSFKCSNGGYFEEKVTYNGNTVYAIDLFDAIIDACDEYFFDDIAEWANNKNNFYDVFKSVDTISKSTVKESIGFKNTKKCRTIMNDKKYVLTESQLNRLLHNKK